MNLLERIFGANWRTTISGVGSKLFLVLGMMAALPYEKDNPTSWTAQIWALIPPNYQPGVLKACFFSALILGAWNAVVQKDKQVVGNGTMSMPNRVPDPETGGNRTVPVLFALLLPAMMLGGCAWLQEPGTKAKLSATGSWLLGKAVGIAMSSVVDLAQSPGDAGKKADWLDSLAAGARASFGSEDWRSLAGIWAPDKPHWQELAVQLEELSKKAEGSGAGRALSPEQRNEVIAQALNLAAQLARAKPVSAFGGMENEKWKMEDVPTLRATPPVLRLDTLYHRGEVIEGPLVVTKQQER